MEALACGLVLTLLLEGRKNLSGFAPDLHYQEAYQQVLVYGPLGIAMGEYVVFLGSSNVVLRCSGRDYQLRSV